MQSVARAVVNAIQARDAVALTALFAPELANALPAQQVLDLWEKTESEHGKYARIYAIRSWADGSREEAFATLMFGSTFADLKVYLKPGTRQVAGLWWSRADASARAVEVLHAMAEGRFDAVVAQFDSGMRAAVPEAKLRAAWDTTVRDLGRFVGAHGSVTRGSGDHESAVVTCAFERGKMDLTLAWSKKDRAISWLFLAPTAPAVVPDAALPTYADVRSYSESEFSVGTGVNALPGTLSMPRGKGPYPAIVLVHGSGPNDRDETLAANRPFRDLASGLASRGIAVLRYDKRTRARPASLAAIGDRLTVREETIIDAAEAIRQLRRTPGIDPANVYVAGHSLGGKLAPWIAREESSVAGIIVLEGAAQPLEDILVYQTGYLMKVSGAPQDAIDRAVADMKRRVDRVKSTDLGVATSKSELPFDIPAAYWLALRGYSPPDTAAQLGKRILVIQGSRDYQVTADGDFALWRKVLQDKRFATLKLLPRLNHLLIAGEGPSTPKEYEIPGHVSPEVIDIIARWVRAAQ